MQLNLCEGATMQLRIETWSPGELNIGMPPSKDEIHSVAVHITQDHLSFTIDTHSYYALPVLRLPGTGISTDPALVSVVPVSNGDILNGEWLATYINRALYIDDVTRPEFFSGLLFSGAQKSMVTSTALPRPWGTSGNHFLSECSLSTAALASLTPGPYIVAHDTLWRAYRLFDDSNGAFMVSCKPNMVPLKQTYELVGTPTKLPVWL